MVWKRCALSVWNFELVFFPRIVILGPLFSLSTGWGLTTAPGQLCDHEGNLRPLPCAGLLSCAGWWVRWGGVCAFVCCCCCPPCTVGSWRCSPVVSAWTFVHVHAHLVGSVCLEKPTNRLCLDQARLAGRAGWWAAWKLCPTSVGLERPVGTGAALVGAAVGVGPSEPTSSRLQGWRTLEVKVLFGPDSGSGSAGGKAVTHLLLRARRTPLPVHFGTWLWGTGPPRFGQVWDALDFPWELLVLYCRVF